MDLPKHGRRRGDPTRVWCCRIRTYVASLRAKIETYRTPPILVGHSLGCLLIEIVLAYYRPPAVVLLAPTRHGIFRRSVLGFLKRHPLLFLELLCTWSMWPPISTPKLCREMLFSPDLPEEELLKWHAFLGNESTLVATELLLGLGQGPAPAHSPEIPTLVMRGDLDVAVDSKGAEDVAKHHGTKMQRVPKIAHDLMLDQGAENVAGEVLQWLATSGIQT